MTHSPPSRILNASPRQHAKRGAIAQCPNSTDLCAVISLDSSGFNLCQLQQRLTVKKARQPASMSIQPARTSPRINRRRVYCMWDFASLPPPSPLFPCLSTTPPSRPFPAPCPFPYGAGERCNIASYCFIAYIHL